MMRDANALDVLGGDGQDDGILGQSHLRIQRAILSDLLQQHLPIRGERLDVQMPRDCAATTVTLLQAAEDDELAVSMPEANRAYLCSRRVDAFGGNGPRFAIDAKAGTASEHGDGRAKQPPLPQDGARWPACEPAPSMLRFTVAQHACLQEWRAVRCFGC
jgi:hypothetical protein